mgnify:CR=1 FL=1
MTSRSRCGIRDRLSCRAKVGTIANVALPTIAAQLDISSANSIWIVNAYQLAIMVTLLSFSALGDVIGYRKVYLVGMVCFTLASAVAIAVSRSHGKWRVPGPNGSAPALQKVCQ